MRNLFSIVMWFRYVMRRPLNRTISDLLNCWMILTLPHHCSWLRTSKNFFGLLWKKKQLAHDWYQSLSSDVDNFLKWLFIYRDGWRACVLSDDMNECDVISYTILKRLQFQFANCKAGVGKKRMASPGWKTSCGSHLEMGSCVRTWQINRGWHGNYSLACLRMSSVFLGNLRGTGYHDSLPRLPAVHINEKSTIYRRFYTNGEGITLKMFIGDLCIELANFSRLLCGVSRIKKWQLAFEL